MRKERQVLPEPTAERRRWDAYWDKHRHDDPYRRAGKFRFASTLELIPPETSSLLDVGAGHGEFAVLAHDRLRHCEITVADRSTTAVEIARERGFFGVVTDLADRLPFAEGSFDTVVTMDVLEHLLDPWSVVEEMARVTRRWVVISCPNFASLQNRLDLLRGRTPRVMGPRYPDHVKFVTFREVRRHLAALGLHVDDYRTQVKLPRSVRRARSPLGIPPVGPKPLLLHRVAPNLATNFTLRAERRRG